MDGHTSQGNLHKLQIMQSNACRMVLRGGKFDNVLAMHNESDLDFLSERRTFHISGFMLKLINSLLKSRELADKFESIIDTHGVSTRVAGRHDLLVPITRTLYGPESIIVYGSKIWNLLPIILRKCKTIGAFTKTTGNCIAEIKKPNSW